jgi:hypothetical protein
LEIKGENFGKLIPDDNNFLSHFAQILLIFRAVKLRSLYDTATSNALRIVNSKITEEDIIKNRVIYFYGENPTSVPSLQVVLYALPAPALVLAPAPASPVEASREPVQQDPLAVAHNSNRLSMAEIRYRYFRTTFLNTISDTLQNRVNTLLPKESISIDAINANKEKIAAYIQYYEERETRYSLFEYTKTKKLDVTAKRIAELIADPTKKLKFVSEVDEKTLRDGTLGKVEFIKH